MNTTKTRLFIILGGLFLSVMAILAQSKVTALQPNGTLLHMVCDSCSTAPADGATYTASATSMSPQGAFYHAVRDTMANGTAGAVAMNINRAQLIQLEDSSKNEIGTNSHPLYINATPTPPTGTATAANSDSIVCATDSGCVVTVTSASYADHSSAVTVGGTSQTALSSNGSRKHAIIQNPCSASETLFVNLTSAASTSDGKSIELAPCASFETPAGTIPLTTEAITVTAATSSHKFIAKEQ